VQFEPTKICKESAGLHRYGKDVSRRGGYVYAAYWEDKVIAIGATVKEARRLYKEAYHVERGVVPRPDGLR